MLSPGGHGSPLSFYLFFWLTTRGARGTGLNPRFLGTSEITGSLPGKSNFGTRCCVTAVSLWTYFLKPHIVQALD